jgi:hypothetical protein
MTPQNKSKSRSRSEGRSKSKSRSKSEGRSKREGFRTDCGKRTSKMILELSLRAATHSELLPSNGAERGADEDEIGSGGFWLETARGSGPSEVRGACGRRVAGLDSAGGECGGSNLTSKA